MSTPPPMLGERFRAAVDVACELHGAQRRIGTEIPYMAHLLVVTGLVVEDGGDEDAAIAALLHDAVEDCGGRATLQRIAAQFGARVAAIVEACSDTIDDPGSERTWRERKQAYLSHLPAIDDAAILRVILADKVHNARSIVRDYRQEGHALWDRFGARTVEDQLWYYRSLLRILHVRCEGPLLEDLRRAVAELTELAELDPISDVPAG